jgi:hypothetical protein
VTNVPALCAQNGPPRCVNTVTGLESNRALNTRGTLMETLTANPVAQARPLHEACEDARRVDCGVCAALSGEECAYTTAPVSLPVTATTLLQPLRGYHVARFGRAMKEGRISGPDLIAVLQTAVVFTVDTVIWESEGLR